MEHRVGVETHVSWVFFAGDRAYKVYKPVKTDVLDASTLEARRALCEQEAEVNRRFAPEAYLGAAKIGIGDEAVEHAVVMRRFHDDERLSHRLGADSAVEDVRAVARRIAVVHAEAPVLDPEIAAGIASEQRLLERIGSDIAGLADQTTGVVDPAVHAHLLELAEQFLSGRADLLEKRIEDGHVIDGHGDLLSEDIFLTDDGPVLLDALAFDSRLRWGDVLADLAFLIMDLQRLGHPELARLLTRQYSEFSGERHPGSLAHYYVAQRAIVRAKVGALRCRQLGADGDWAPVVDLIHQAADHLDRAQVRLLMVGGIPGSGKTSVAASVADAMGWVHLSTDEHRRDLGLFGAEGYDDESKDRVYGSMLDHARALLRAGTSVVLDSAWDRDHRRCAARALAEQTRATVHEIRCVVPVELARQRITERGQVLSEATPHVVDLLDTAFEAWNGAHELDTSGSLTQVVGRLLGVLPDQTWTTHRSGR